MSSERFFMGHHEERLQYTLKMRVSIMNRTFTNKVNASSSRPFFVCLVLLLSTWVAVFFQGLITAIDIWLISDIFNHCLFVIPGSIFLIYLKRRELSLQYFKPNYFVLILCLGSLFLYAIGLAGDLQLFIHVSTFTFLPLSIWAFIGNQLALKILFPLIFILFCIPVGEELIPALQEVTADLSMVMLDWSGIPVYRNGLYIEIPQGQFLVAEACSGISFFIASLVIGSLYTYLNISSIKRRIIFMLISIALPIIANGIRVSGIILTGHLTDMKHAVGADHLIYGWVFFSIVMVCLLGIGEMVREKHPQVQSLQPELASERWITDKSFYPSLICIIVLMVAYSAWFRLINTQLNQSSATTHSTLSVTERAEQANYSSNWKPEFIEPAQEFHYSRIMLNTPIDVYVAWYPLGHGELITTGNRLYTEKSWTLESNSNLQLESDQNIRISAIVNHSNKRLLSSWYLIDGKMFTNNKIAKLYETYQILMGNHVGSALIAISQQTKNVSAEQESNEFQAILKQTIIELNKTIEIKSET
jgi:exosortase A